MLQQNQIAIFNIEYIYTSLIFLTINVQNDHGLTISYTTDLMYKLHFQNSV